MAGFQLRATRIVSCLQSHKTLSGMSGLQTVFWPVAGNGADCAEVCALYGADRRAGLLWAACSGDKPRSGHQPELQAPGLSAGCSQKWLPCTAVCFFRAALTSCCPHKCSLTSTS